LYDGRDTVPPVGVPEATDTVALCDAEPPAPVQLSVYVVGAVIAAVACEPAVASEPVQPPEAVQAVALVDDQVNVDSPPLATLVGLALIDTLGAAEAAVGTVTVAVWDVEPPVPVQLSTKLVVTVSGEVL
jgi:hypothetical protein